MVRDKSLSYYQRFKKLGCTSLSCVEIWLKYLRFSRDLIMLIIVSFLVSSTGLRGTNLNFKSHRCI